MARTAAGARWIRLPPTWHYLGGALLGLAVGALIAYDAMIANFVHLELAHHYLLRRLPFPSLRGHPAFFIYYEVPYIVTGIAALVAIGTGMLLVHLETVWRHRFKILLALVIVSIQNKALLAAGPLDISDVAAAAFLGIWMLHMFMNERERFPLGLPFFLLLGLYGSMLLSTVNGRVPSLLFMVAQSKNLVLFGLLAHLLRTREMLAFFVKSLVLVTALSSVIGIAQEILFLVTGEMYVGIIEERSKFLMLEESSLGTLLRVPAFFGFVQNFALTLAVVSTVVLWLILSPDLKIIRRRGMLYPIFLLLLTNLILTFSKGALLGFLFASILMLYLRWPSRAVHFTAALAGLALFAVIAAMLNPSLAREAVGKVQAEFSYGELHLRLSLDRQSLVQTPRRHPFIGVGLGLGRKYTQHALNWPAHNAFLLALAEVGLVGFLWYVSVFILMYVRVIAIMGGVQDAGTRSMARMFLAGFIAFTIFYQAEPFFQISFTWIYWGMMEGLVGAKLTGHRALLAPPAAARTNWAPCG